MQSLKSIAYECFEELVNKKNLETPAFENFSKEVVFDNLFGRRIGIKAVKSYLLSAFNAFPDYSAKIDKIDIYGNTVVVSNINMGTHTDPFTESLNGMNQSVYLSSLYYRLTNQVPDGKNLNIFNEAILVFSNKKIQRFTVSVDTISVCKQLGLFFSEPVEQKNKKKLLIKRLRHLENPPFTEKETICLALNLSGLSAKQIGEITGNSHRTIEAHIQNATRKGGCFSTLHLIEKMIANEMLPLWHELCCLILNLTCFPHQKVKTHEFNFLEN